MDIIFASSEVHLERSIGKVKADQDPYFRVRPILYHIDPIEP